MSEPSAQVLIPKRALFKAAEVCDIVNVQPYVLRSWEAEFPALGVVKSTAGPRIYRREDVELALRIKHLLLVEGLTLAGARRRLDEEVSPVTADASTLDALIGRNARERLTEIKRGLRWILDLLGDRSGSGDFRLSAPPARTPLPRPAAGRSKGSRTKPAPRRSAASRRRKHSA